MYDVFLLEQVEDFPLAEGWGMLESMIFTISEEKCEGLCTRAIAVKKLFKPVERQSRPLI